MIRLKSIGAACCAGFLSVAFAFAYASSIPTVHAASDDCGITQSDIASIQAIQNDTALSSVDEINQELAARKILLIKSVTCAEQDVRTLQTQLNSVSVSGAAAIAIQTQLSGDLDDAVKYYESELAKADGSGISGTEQVAREVLVWRESNYTPLAGQVSNFTLWAQNQSLFATAAARMNQINQLGSFLSPVNNGDLATALAAAQTSFKTAQDQNVQAQTALSQNLPPSESLALIQDSLKSLAQTYQAFFDVSTVVQGLLPATPSGS